MSAHTPFLAHQPSGDLPLSYPMGEMTVMSVGRLLHPARLPALARAVEQSFEEGRSHIVLDLLETRGGHEAFGFVWATLRAVRRRGGTLGVVGDPAMLRALDTLGAEGLDMHLNVGAALSAGPRRRGAP